MHKQYLSLVEITQAPSVKTALSVKKRIRYSTVSSTQVFVFRVKKWGVGVSCKPVGSGEGREPVSESCETPPPLRGALWPISRKARTHRGN